MCLIRPSKQLRLLLFSLPALLIYVVHDVTTFLIRHEEKYVAVQILFVLTITEICIDSSLLLFDNVAQVVFTPDALELDSGKILGSTHSYQNDVMFLFFLYK